jgi:hypothetical protein
MISASNPSSLKKPFFCARGSGVELAPGANPIRILSAASTEASKRKTANKTAKNTDIGSFFLAGA